MMKPLPDVLTRKFNPKYKVKKSCNKNTASLELIMAMKEGDSFFQFTVTKIMTGFIRDFAVSEKEYHEKYKALIDG